MTSLLVTGLLLLLRAMSNVFKPKGRFASFKYASQPSQLNVKRKDGKVEQISIKTLLESRCPSLFFKYSPAWWLPNGHLQTAYGVSSEFPAEDQVWYRRTFLRLADGGTIGLDFTPAEGFKTKKDTPIIVIQHGLSGGSHEPYIRAILSHACAPPEEGGIGFRAVVINFRGCGGVPLTSPLFYSAGSTDDTRQALMYITHLYPNAPLLGLGFSLGSNVLTRYLAEEGDQSRLVAGCVLACPWDMKRNGDSLVQTFLGKQLWSKGMGRNMVALVKRHTKAFLSDPDSEAAKATRKTVKLWNPTLDEFDNAFTRITGGATAPFPFRDAAALYTWVATHNILHKIRVPFLAINAADDPVVRHVPEDCAENGMVVLVTTVNGGHLGWFQSAKSSDRWTTKPVLEWLKMAGEDIQYDPLPRGSPLYLCKDNFLRDREKPHLGCKVIEGGGLIDGNAGEQKIFEGL